jgi:very-short-patch-repair endonuclease
MEKQTIKKQKENKEFICKKCNKKYKHKKTFIKHKCIKIKIRYCKNKNCIVGENNNKKILNNEYHGSEKYCSNKCWRIDNNYPFYCQNSKCNKGENDATKKLSKKLKYCCCKSCASLIIKHSKEHCKKIWKTRRKNGTDKMSEEQKNKLSYSLKHSEKFQKAVQNEDRKKKISKSQKGKKLSKKTKEKISESVTNYRVKNEHWCSIGKHEIQLLNEQEIKDSCKIIRQYRIGKFFLDGYCKETNTVYEIYEKRHFLPKSIKKDLKRQRKIENKLNCNFIIIKDLL